MLCCVKTKFDICEYLLILSMNLKVLDRKSRPIDRDEYIFLYLHFLFMFTCPTDKFAGKLIRPGTKEL